ncbi:MAG: SBBP repeat-containing protein, partial [Acidobacteria bacterium]|nr:SBBP repeat-containing protein [Acidobacteriota bacterium]
MITVRLHILSLGLLILLGWSVLSFPNDSGPRSESPQSLPNSRFEARVDDAYGRLTLSFEANRGQTDSQVKFLSRGPDYTLFLSPLEMVLTMAERTGSGETQTQEHVKASEPPVVVSTRRPLAAFDSHPAVLRMKLTNANPSPKLLGMDELPGKVNQFVGDKPDKWRANIPTYTKVKYEDVYPGVDLIYYGSQLQLEYDFVVAPGADPNTIRLAFEGADNMEVDGEGNLILHVAGSDVIQRAPKIYQEIDGIRQTVGGGYILSEIADRKSNLENPDVGFRVAAYDASKPLIIDPVLVYSTYLGGSGNDRFPIMAVDATGNVYLACQTNSTNFPTANPVQPANGGSVDVCVAKLNATGTALLYSTYLGGSGGDDFPSIAVDRAGSAYVIGRTRSLNFPTVNPLQPTHGGGMFDAFVAKLNATGSVLVYSTYLGGSGDEISWDIKVDATGNAYAGGSTNSTNFPTVNAFQPTLAGGSDVFVAKLNAAGSALVYSTYLGGSGDELRTPQLAVDDAGNAYVHGQTTSTNFPTVNPFQPANGGGMDVFVAKLNAAGTSV